MPLRFTLFDTFRIHTPAGETHSGGSPKTRSLLAYLVLHRKTPLDRRRLAFIFWSDVGETAARRNLRQYLHHVRTVLAPFDSAGAWLKTDGHFVHFAPPPTISVDVEDFQALTADPQAPLQNLQAAVELYTGDLLQDLYDDWCIPLRESLRRTWLQSLTRLTWELVQAGLLDDALSYAIRWQQADPLDENALQQIMQIRAQMGDRQRALQAYQDFAQQLRAELDAAPLPTTQALYHAIRQGQLPQTKPAPAHPSRRNAPTPSPAPRPEPAIPLIGRARERQQLEALIHQATSGHGGVTLVEGETGIGKTRLRQYVEALLANGTVFSVTCYELDSLAPFSALRQNLPAALLPAKNQPATWAAALLTHSRRTPPLLALLLDDFHWADLSTWELLGWLARQAANAPLFVLAFYRPEDLQPEQRAWLGRFRRSKLVTHLTLPPFTPAETTELVRRLAPEHADDPIFIQRLQRDTHGNPFFLVETLHALQENSGRFGTLPRNIQNILEARLDRLPPESRAALQAAAAIGRDFSFGLLQAVTGLETQALVAFLEEWQQRSLLDEQNGRYDFRHDQIRTVAYNQLSAARRQYLHGKIATALKNAVPPVEAATLAYHYSRSERPIQALPWLIQAGEQALALRSYQEAARFGLQALNLLGQLPGPQAREERVDVQLQLAQAYAFTGDIARAIQSLLETLEWAHTLNDPLRLGFLYRRLAQFFWLQGDPQTAGTYARRALQLAEETGHRRLERAALRMLGRVGIALAEFDDAILFLTRHTRQAEAPSHQQAVAFGYLGVAYARVGVWEAALQAARRALQMAEDTLPPGNNDHVIFTRVQLAMVQADRHDWQACLTTLAPISWPKEPEGWTPALFMARSLLGLARAQSGAAHTGRQDLETAIAWGKRKNYRVFAYLPQLYLGQACLLDGDLSAAASAAQTALTASQNAGNRWASALAHALLAEIGQHRPAPDWAQIEDHLLQAVSLLRSVRARPDLARTYLALRRLYDRAGRIAWAVDCHFRAVAIFDELDMLAERRAAQGRPSSHGSGGVLPDLPLRGPNKPGRPE